MQNRLKPLMESRGISVRKLALDAGVSPEKVTWARMGGRLSQPVASRLAAALGIEAAKLFPDFSKWRAW